MPMRSRSSGCSARRLSRWRCISIAIWMAAWAWSWFRKTGGDHIGAADGLDLFETKAPGGAVKADENLVEHSDQTRSIHFSRNLGEADDVREQDAGFRYPVGDEVGGVLQPVGDRSRQDVQKQALRARRFPVQCSLRRIEKCTIVISKTYRQDDETIDGRVFAVSKNAAGTDPSRRPCLPDAYQPSTPINSKSPRTVDPIGLYRDSM
jgi:hypothetical protein